MKKNIITKSIEVAIVFFALFALINVSTCLVRVGIILILPISWEDTYFLGLIGLAVSCIVPVVLLANKEEQL